MKKNGAFVLKKIIATIACLWCASMLQAGLGSVISRAGEAMSTALSDIKTTLLRLLKSIVHVSDAEVQDAVADIVADLAESGTLAMSLQDLSAILETDLPGITRQQINDVADALAQKGVALSGVISIASREKQDILATVRQILNVHIASDNLVLQTLTLSSKDIDGICAGMSDWITAYNKEDKAGMSRASSALVKFFPSEFSTAGSSSWSLTTSMLNDIKTLLGRAKTDPTIDVGSELEALLDKQLATKKAVNYIISSGLSDIFKLIDPKVSFLSAADKQTFFAFLGHWTLAFEHGDAKMMEDFRLQLDQFSRRLADAGKIDATQRASIKQIEEILKEAEFAPRTYDIIGALRA